MSNPGKTSRSEARVQGTLLLKASSVDSPELSALVLLEHALGISRIKLLTEPFEAVTADQLAAYNSLISQRALGCPLAYLTGYKEFFGLNFKVSPDVLIPRPETEELVQLVVDDWKNRPAFFADIGVGSGAIIISVLAHTLRSAGIGIDISSAALQIARENIGQHQLSGKAQLCRSSYLSALGRNCLDFIVSNPPYISRLDYQKLDREVLDFEPQGALLGGETGLEPLTEMSSQAQRLLRSGGCFYAEIGYDQGEDSKQIFSRWRSVTILKDLSGHDRIVRAVSF